MMLKYLSIAALFVMTFAGRDDPVHDEPPSGDCKEKCAPARCNKWAPEDHPCASLEVKRGIAIDPWRCGEPRCQETSCDKCGDHDKCVDMCEDHKADMVSKGYELDDGYPNCDEACGEAADPSWMCFEDTCYPDMDAMGRPECYEYWECSEPYCSARGRQYCYAKNNYFDPWGDSVGDSCKITQCRRCGPHEKCLDFCNAWNDRKANPDKINCEAECRAVKGWACYFTPAPQDEEEAAVKGHIHSGTKSLGYGYPLGFAAFAGLALAAYYYRSKNKQYTAI